MSMTKSEIGKPVIGYHFTSARLRNGDPIPPVGEWLEWTGPVRMCVSGLHYSLDPFDALQYAPGPFLHQVEVEDIVDTQADKGVCRRRRILRSGDATAMLMYFARMRALSVVHLWKAPDVVLDYLMTGDDALRDATEAIAWDATGAAAWAARDAARDAAWDARAAARAAAWAARDAAWAAQDAARQDFNQLVQEFFA